MFLCQWQVLIRLSKRPPAQRSYTHRWVLALPRFLRPEVNSCDLFYHSNRRPLFSSAPHHLMDPLKTGPEPSSPRNHNALQCLVHNSVQYLRNEWFTVNGWNPRKIKKIKQKRTNLQEDFVHWLFLQIIQEFNNQWPRTCWCEGNKLLTL